MNLYLISAQRSMYLVYNVLQLLLTIKEQEEQRDTDQNAAKTFKNHILTFFHGRHLDKASMTVLQM